MADSVYRTIQNQSGLIPVKIKYSETTIAKMPVKIKRVFRTLTTTSVVASQDKICKSLNNTVVVSSQDRNILVRFG